MVVDAEGGEQAATYQGAGDDGAEDGIAVVEQTVGIVAFAAAGEGWQGGEHVAPVEGGGATFEVGAVAGEHFACPLLHIAYLDAVQLVKQGGLIAYFLLHGLLPKLLAQRQAGINLVLETFALYGISFEWQQQAYGHVSVITGDDGGIVIDQGRQCSMGECNLPVVKHYHTDVLDGHGGLPLGLVVVWIKPDDKLPVAQREVGWVREAKGAFDHLCVMNFSLPMLSILK